MDSLGNAEGFNSVMTTLQVCERCRTALFPVAVLIETSSADPLDEGFRWQVVVGSGTLSPCGFGQPSAALPMWSCLAAGWPEKRLRSVLEAMAGIQGWAQWRTDGPTAAGTLQYSRDQLADVVVLGRMWFGVLFIPGCLKIVHPSVIHWETHHPIY